MSSCGSISTRTLQITRCPFPELLPVLWCEDGQSNFYLDFGDSGITLDSTRCGPSIPTVACCSRHTIQKFWNFKKLLPYRITIKVRNSSQIVLSSHQQLLLPHQREADRNAMADRRLHANCFPSFSISKLCLKSRVQLSCATKGARNPYVRLWDLQQPPSFSMSVLLWQLRLPEYVSTSRESWWWPQLIRRSKVKMPICARLLRSSTWTLVIRVTMLSPRPSDYLEDLMKQSRPRSKFDALFANVWQNPLLSLPLFSDVAQNLDNVWHLISSCLQTSTGKTVSF